MEEQREKNAGGAERERLKREIDGLIAGECPLTGNVVIEKITKALPGTELSDSDDFVTLSVHENL